MWFHVSCNCIASWCFFGNWMLWAFIFFVQYFACVFDASRHNLPCVKRQVSNKTHHTTPNKTCHTLAKKKKRHCFQRWQKHVWEGLKSSSKVLQIITHTQFWGHWLTLQGCQQSLLFPQRPRHFFQKTPPEFLQPSIYIGLNDNAGRSLIEKHGCNSIMV